MSARHSSATAGEIEVRRDKPANPEPPGGRTPMVNTAQTSLPAFGSCGGVIESERRRRSSAFSHNAVYERTWNKCERILF
jgi:hypothetical protein